MTPTDRPLGGYETRLLAELIEYTAGLPEELATGHAPGSRRRARRRPVLMLVAAVVAAVALAVGVPAIIGSGGSPAYAVSLEPDGTIKVLIREYRDPQGLARKLREAGVTAVIDYLPSGMRCKEPRANYAPDVSDLWTFDDSAKTADNVFYLHSDRIPPGQTLIYTVWLYESDDGGASYSSTRLAYGPVAPCEQIPGGPKVSPGSIELGDSPSEVPDGPYNGPGNDN